MIYVTGDTHGVVDIDKVTRYHFPDGDKLTKDDYLIICGDFGAYMYNSPKDEQLLDFWQDKPYTVLFLDGNHENFNRLSEIDVVEWHGGLVQFLRPTVIHLMRGQIYTLEEKTFFVFGGAYSIDKAMRVENVSWWPQEEANYSECEEGLNNLSKVGNKVDFILTHAAPQWIKANIFQQVMPLKADRSVTEAFLDEIFNKVSYDYWFCGHYHKDFRVRQYNIEVLYKNIIKIAKGFPVASRN